MPVVPQAGTPVATESGIRPIVLFLLIFLVLSGLGEATQRSEAAKRSIKPVGAVLSAIVLAKADTLNRPVYWVGGVLHPDCIDALAYQPNETDHLTAKNAKITKPPAQSFSFS